MFLKSRKFSLKGIRILSRQFSKMRAVIVSEFGDPSVLKVGETDIPTHNPKQCLIRLHACGVNPVDTYIRSGKYPKLPSLPFIPGKDGAGVVESIGSEVHNVKVGDRVYIFGAITGSYADYTICNDSNVFKLPNHISFEEGACLGTPAFTAYRALFQKANGKSGESVFIHGASGGVGLSAIELALSAGLTVVGTAGTSIGTETILKLGVKHAFNHNDPNYLQEIQALYPKGFNICLEMLASTNLSKDFQIMPSRGRIAIIGNRGEILINPRDIMSKELQVYGVALLQSTTEELKEASEYIGQCLEKRQLNPLITMRYNFENAPSAHTEIINRTNLSNGNIILVP